MTYKDLPTSEKILIPTGIIFLSVFLLYVVTYGYEKQSYNQGFYDGVNAFCEEEGVVIVNDKFVCYEDYVEQDLEFDLDIDLGYTGK